jgi:uncharacterized protein (TIGR02996 family)
MSPADEEPFLDAILARYTDDEPRLVYADWLDENGDPDRADLVRVQLALARLPDDHPRRTELADRQNELHQKVAEVWMAHLDGLATGIEFRRGVLDSVTADATAFLLRGDTLFRLAPVVRRVRLTDAARAMSELIHCPFVARVRELDLFGNDLGNRGADEFLRCAYLGGLDALDLGFNGLDDAGVRILARASTLPNLHELALNDNRQITGEAVRLLADSPFYAGLRALDLSGNIVNDAGVRAVVESRSLGRLTGLKLTENHIGDAGVAVLVGSALFRRMLARDPRVDLRANEIGPAGAAVLARSAAMKSAVTIDLTRNSLGDAGVEALLGGPHLAGVRVLRLGQNQVTDAGAAALAVALPRFPRLRRLDVSGNQLTRRGIKQLTEARAGRPPEIDTDGNIHQVPPVAVGEVVAGVLDDALADLKRRITHPTVRRGS